VTQQIKDLQIKTSRTHLRLVLLEDLTFVHELHSLKETDQFNTLGIPSEETETLKVLNKWIADYKLKPISSYTFIIEHEKTKKEIGLICLKMGNTKYKRAEVWFRLHVDFWNQGLATEVLLAILDFGFGTLNLHRIEAGCAVNNIGSVKVLEKAGFIREGRGRKVLPLKSGWSDNFEYSIL